MRVIYIGGLRPTGVKDRTGENQSLGTREGTGPAGGDWPWRYYRSQLQKQKSEKEAGTKRGVTSSKPGILTKRKKRGERKERFRENLEVSRVLFDKLWGEATSGEKKKRRREDKFQVSSRQASHMPGKDPRSDSNNRGRGKADKERETKPGRQALSKKMITSCNQ